VFRLPLLLTWSSVLHLSADVSSQYVLIIVLLGMICYLSTVFWTNIIKSQMVFEMVSAYIFLFSPLVRPHQIILPFYSITMPLVVTSVLSLIYSWKLSLACFKLCLCPLFPSWGDRTNTESFKIFLSRVMFLHIPHNHLSTRWLTLMISLAHGELLKLSVQSFRTYPQVLKLRPETSLKLIAPFLSCRHSGLPLWCTQMRIPFASTRALPLEWAYLRAHMVILLMQELICFVQLVSAHSPSGLMIIYFSAFYDAIWRIATVIANLCIPSCVVSPVVRLVVVYGLKVAPLLTDPLKHFAKITSSPSVIYHPSQFTHQETCFTTATSRTSTCYPPYLGSLGSYLKIFTFIFKCFSSVCSGTSLISLLGWEMPRKLNTWLLLWNGHLSKRTSFSTSSNYMGSCYTH
jgi:hypothetical protein